MCYNVDKEQRKFWFNSVQKKRKLQQQKKIKSTSFESLQNKKSLKVFVEVLKLVC